MLPLNLWLDALKSRGIEDSDAVPAVRLVEFIEAMPLDPLQLDVRDTLKVVPEMDYGELSSDLVVKYLKIQMSES